LALDHSISRIRLPYIRLRSLHWVQESLDPVKILDENRHLFHIPSQTLLSVRGCGVPRLHQAHLARGSVTRRISSGINRLATGHAEQPRKHTDPCIAPRYHRVPRRAAPQNYCSTVDIPAIFGAPTPSRDSGKNTEQNSAKSVSLKCKYRPSARFLIFTGKYRPSARRLIFTVRIVRPRVSDIYCHVCNYIHRVKSPSIHILFYTAPVLYPYIYSCLSLLSCAHIAYVLLC
jgi:hypothetical protein